MNTGGYNPLGIGAGTLVAGRYELVEKIGSGAMSVVFRAIDRRLENELIALKLFSPNFSDPERFAERFRNEVQITRLLTHPNIVRTFDFGTTEQGQHYITMELVEGFTLEQFMNAQTHHGFPTEEIVRILHDVCQAIGYAHCEGVVHRDLKPANVLIASDGDIKITDFGLARMFELDQRMTQTGECVGTPLYMAPEQVQDHEVDPRTDIYALGILAYQLATGELPFEQGSWFDLASKIVNDPIPPLPLKHVPEWYAEFVQKATAKCPDERFGSAAEVVELLRQQVVLDECISTPISLNGNGARGCPRIPEREFNLNGRFMSSAPVMLFGAVLLFVLIAVVGFSKPAVDKASGNVKKNMKAVDQFANTIHKLHDAAVKFHKDRDKIEAFLEEPASE